MKPSALVFAAALFAVPAGADEALAAYEVSNSAAPNRRNGVAGEARARAARDRTRPGR